MTPDRQSARMRDICALAPVIPVIVVDDLDHAVPLAKALVAGGLPVLEVTLRTPVALDVIKAMADLGTAPVSAEEATPEALKAKLESEIARWKPVIGSTAAACTSSPRNSMVAPWSYKQCCP